MKQLPLPDIIRFRQTSKRINNIFFQDYDWKDLILNHFDLTEQKVISIQRQLNKSYKELYQYCKDFEPNQIQKMALRSFAKDGLKKEHFIGHEWFLDVLDINRLRLIKNNKACKLSYEQALRELKELDQPKKAEIGLRVSLETVKKLNNFQIKFIGKLADFLYEKNVYPNLDYRGLKTLVIKQIINQDWLNSDSHVDTYFHLIRHCNKNYIQAFEEIMELNEVQVIQLQMGSSRQDVLNSNFSQTFKI